MSRLMFSCFCILLFCLCNFALSVSSQSNLFPDKDVCGKKEEQRIYGGEEATIGEFPWLVLLGHRSDNITNFYCGGALINHRYILTAAHCVDDRQDNIPGVDMVVRLGEHNKTSEQDCEGESGGLEYCSDPPLDLGAEKIILHQNYISGHTNHRDDIALIRLNEEVPYTDFIKPVCLPITSELRNSTFADATVVVAGWGVTETQKRGSDIKLKVELPVKRNKSCQKFYRLFGKEVLATQLCAGGQEGKDSCQGDSGGPLIYSHQTDDDENWVAVGVVSYGMGCGHLVPGIYTRVTEYIDWITENMTP